MDWAVLSSWVAAVISVTALGVTLWVRARDRTEPAWYVEDMLGDPIDEVAGSLKEASGRPALESLMLSASNDGDGAAHRVRFTCDMAQVVMVIGDTSDQRGWRLSRSAERVPPGGNVALYLWGTDGPNLTDAVLTVRWRRSPIRHRRDQVMRIPLRDPRHDLPLTWWARAKDKFRRRVR